MARVRLDLARPGAVRRAPWRCLLASAVGVLSVLCSATACSAGPSSGQPADPPSGSASSRPVTLAPCARPRGHAAPEGGLPDITLNCLGAGPAVNLAALTGPAVVNLWAAWCYPCRAEMPLLEKVSVAHRGSAHILGVDTNDKAAAARAFAEKTVRAGYEELSDPTGKLALALHAPGLPYTVAIDRAGVVVWRHAGKLTNDDIAKAVHDAQK